MRSKILAVAFAAVFVAGCSSSNESSSSGSSGGSTGSTSTTGSTGSTGSSGSTGRGSSTGSGSSSGSTSTSTSGSGGSSGAAADFSCLGNQTIPAISSSPATVSLTLADRNNAPLEGVVVKACNANDTSCTSPVVTSAPTDSSGQTSLAIDLTAAGDGGFLPFTGYLDFSGADAGGGDSVIPSLVFGPPIVGDVSQGLVGIKASDLQLLSFLLNKGPAPDLANEGQILGNVDDCVLKGVAGATVAVDPTLPDGGTTTYYFANNSSLGGEVPSAAATSTDSSGDFLITNVPPGTATVTTTASVSGTSKTTAVYPVITRVNTITTVLARPNQ